MWNISPTGFTAFLWDTVRSSLCSECSGTASVTTSLIMEAGGTFYLFKEVKKKGCGWRGGEGGDRRGKNKKVLAEWALVVLHKINLSWTMITITVISFLSFLINRNDEKSTKIVAVPLICVTWVKIETNDLKSCFQILTSIFLTETYVQRNVSERHQNTEKGKEQVKDCCSD